MRFQERDGEILRAIHEIGDGVLARRHIKQLFWPDTTERAMQMRLAALKRAGYITWPSPQERIARPVPEPIVYLAARGSIWLAGQYGIAVKEPAGENEYQMRELERGLRRQGFRWA